jgi:hypothetical protein
MAPIRAGSQSNLEGGLREVVVLLGNVMGVRISASNGGLHAAVPWVTRQPRSHVPRLGSIPSSGTPMQLTQPFSASVANRQVPLDYENALWLQLPTGVKFKIVFVDMNSVEHRLQPPGS